MLNKIEDSIYYTSRPGWGWIVVAFVAILVLSPFTVVVGMVFLAVTITAAHFYVTRHRAKEKEKKKKRLCHRTKSSE